MIRVSKPVATLQQQSSPIYRSALAEPDHVAPSKGECGCHAEGPCNCAATHAAAATWDFSQIPISQPDDVAERAADRLADEAMRRPGPDPQTPPDVVPGRSGAPLPPSQRADFEARFDYDFSRVRIHTDEDASALNRGLHAEAFTFGNDVYVDKAHLGRPATTKLLAHELAHVVQGDRSPALARQVAAGSCWGGRRITPRS
jgi:hypothetical protein